MPNIFGHDARGCTLVYDTLVNCDIMDWHCYLEGDHGRKPGGDFVEVKSQ